MISQCERAKRVVVPLAGRPSHIMQNHLTDTARRHLRLLLPQCLLFHLQNLVVEVVELAEPHTRFLRQVLVESWGLRSYVTAVVPVEEPSTVLEHKCKELRC